MRKFFAVGIGVLMVALVSAVPASAVQLTGGYAISGNFNWVDNDTGTTVNVFVSDAFDFETVGNSPTPGVPGQFVVNNSSGSFAVLGGCPPSCTPATVGTIRDFTFVGAGNVNYPDLTSPLIDFEVVTGGGITFHFDLVSIGTPQPNGNGSLDINGTGIFRATGFDPTPGIWAFSGQNAGGVFSFSASQAARVPESTTLLILGTGLVGLGLSARRIGRK